MDLGGRLFTESNKIGDTGVHYFADALRFNKVASHIFVFYTTNHVFLTQTLTVLDLGYNEIGDIGGQCLVPVLRQNKVIY